MSTRDQKRSKVQEKEMSCERALNLINENYLTNENYHFPKTI